MHVMGHNLHGLMHIYHNRCHILWYSMTACVQPVTRAVCALTQECQGYVHMQARIHLLVLVPSPQERGCHRLPPLSISDGPPSSSTLTSVHDQELRAAVEWLLLDTSQALVGGDYSATTWLLRC